jgi:hypothetical protein
MLQPPTHTYHRTMATHIHDTALAAAANLQTFPGLLPRYHVQNDITAIHCCHGPNRPWADPHSSLHHDSRLLQKRSYVISTVPRKHSSAAHAAYTCTDASVRYSEQRRHHTLWRSCGSTHMHGQIDADGTNVWNRRDPHPKTPLKTPLKTACRQSLLEQQAKVEQTKTTTSENLQTSGRHIFCNLPSREGQQDTG